MIGLQAALKRLQTTGKITYSGHYVCLALFSSQIAAMIVQKEEVE